MRLDIEKAKKCLQGMHRLWLCNEWGQQYDSERCQNCDSDDNCFNIIMSATCMSDIAQDLLDTIEALHQENEQLKADIRGKDNEINDLEALADYLRKFKPKKKKLLEREVYEVE